MNATYDDGQRRKTSEPFPATGQPQHVQGGDIGTAFGILIDTTPTNGANPYLDTLNGGSAWRNENGQSGTITFVFTLRTGLDHIADFGHISDHIELSRKTMGALGPLGTLQADAFYAGPAAHDASDRIIYDPSRGALFYDPDGTGTKAAIEIAVLDRHPTLTATELWVA